MEERTLTMEEKVRTGINLYVDEEYKLFYFHKIEDARELMSLLNTNDVFYSKEFYKAVEEYTPSNTIFKYAFLFKDQELKAFFHFQIKKIDLGESLESAYDSSKSHTFIEKVSHNLKLFIARKLKYYTLVSGNMLQTGRYGLYTAEGFELGLALYNKVLDAVSKQLKSENISVAGILMKDFYEYHHFDKKKAKKLGYHEFSVQPTMLMDIPDHWHSMDDYMDSIKSKYKVRTRRTFKKCEQVEKVDLSLEMLDKWSSRMHGMYENIATQASFNLFILDDLYFYGLKAHLKEKCKVIGYFCKGEMIGFYTIIYNEDVVDAHFLGYDHEFNKTMHLYHNMLYDLLEEAIKTKSKKLDLSRTAMAIKSSIGAVPHKLFLYLRLRNKFLNVFTPKVLDYLTPQIEWEQRNPFK